MEQRRRINMETRGMNAKHNLLTSWNSWGTSWKANARFSRGSDTFGLASCRATIILAAALFAASAGADDWPQFLGPQRNGVSNEQGLLTEWPQGGLKELWRAQGGVGMASVVVDRGQALTMVQDDSQQALLALNAKTGEPAWRAPDCPGLWQRARRRASRHSSDRRTAGLRVYRRRRACGGGSYKWQAALAAQFGQVAGRQSGGLRDGFLAAVGGRLRCRDRGGPPMPRWSPVIASREGLPGRLETTQPVTRRPRCLKWAVKSRSSR